ncbi:hypothetical protein J2W37_002387 [Variovorax paradoxus]|uniref:Uncharacterized protein n=1 Tax=Variovorax paradoxus TaxID=34073 RepID=A0AAE3Y1D0_VARPD|nr:hypothetical protein [Variovorax paradoxus]MDP9964667.1 hypothetical protein [Variovorax paradoxus]MDR6427566.1 hypothetical protein [Variovorax paradoxus]
MSEAPHSQPEVMHEVRGHSFWITINRPEKRHAAPVSLPVSGKASARPEPTRASAPSCSPALATLPLVVRIKPAARACRWDRRQVEPHQILKRRFIKSVG